MEKDVVDEIIFRTRNPRNRLILELMSCSCMRVGEVLKLTFHDIDKRKAIIRDPKSGQEAEVAFLPQEIADLLKKYVNDKGIKTGNRIYSITYAAVRIVVKQAGELIGIHLRPPELRRHAAKYASRSGTPLEIVSKVLLRHSIISTTLKYLGKISDAEAIRWIDNLHG